MHVTTQIEIPMLFTRRGAPANDINAVTPGYPKVRIWDSDNNIVLNGSQMTLVSSGGVNDGIYKFVFTSTNGFDPEKKYITTFDGGRSLPNAERYNYGQIVPSFDSSLKDEIDVARKFETNKTEIDVNNAEMIIYDDDQTTILWRYKLLDSRGNPNVDEIASRVPVGGTKFNDYNKASPSPTVNP